MSLSGAAVVRALSVGVAAARRAGQVAKEVLLGGELGVVEKSSSNDLQTAADRRAQRLILASLARAVPLATLIGEEERDESPLSPDEERALEEVLSRGAPAHLLSEMSELEKERASALYSTNREEELVVWVDPLDGTNEYTQGHLDHVTVLVGVALGGRPVGGVVHQPFYGFRAAASPALAPGRTLWGLVGVALYGTITTFTERAPLEMRRLSASRWEVSNLIITTTRSHNTSQVEECLSSLKGQLAEVVRVGGAGHKVLLLLEGRADSYLYPRAGTKKWDTAAPEALLRAAGGLLTDCLGAQLEYDADAPHLNARGLLATRSPALHEHLLAAIPQQVRRQLNNNE